MQLHNHHLGCEFCFDCVYSNFFFFNSPAALAEVLRDARDSMTSMQTVLDRYASLLDSNSPEVHLFQFLSSTVFFLNIKVL